MAIPLGAKVIAEPMDPTDQTDFAFDLTESSDPTVLYPFLQDGETVASFTLALTAEAVAAGLTIMNDTDRSPRRIGRSIIFWLTVATGMRANAMFDDAGVSLPLELTVVTDATPPRTKQRTGVVVVRQR